MDAMIMEVYMLTCGHFIVLHLFARNGRFSADAT